MSIDELLQVEWLDPWHRELSGLERELASEVSPQHPLFQLEAVAIARRIDNDDVLFFLPASIPSLAVVHLTWRTETVAEWPLTRFYSSLEDFTEHCMKADHREYLAVNQNR